MMVRLTPFEARQWPPLALAYLGDAVLEISVRERILLSGSFRMNLVHRKTVRYVRASAQADAMIALESQLNGEEEAIYKRGRNAKPGHVRRNADLTEYRLATGFEALVGYLHLTDNQERLSWVLDTLYETVEGKETR